MQAARFFPVPWGPFTCSSTSCAMAEATNIKPRRKVMMFHDCKRYKSKQARLCRQSQYPWTRSFNRFSAFFVKRTCINQIIGSNVAVSQVSNQLFWTLRMPADRYNFHGVLVAFGNKVPPSRSVQRVRHIEAYTEIRHRFFSPCRHQLVSITPGSLIEITIRYAKGIVFCMSSSFFILLPLTAENQ